MTEETEKVVTEDNSNENSENTEQNMKNTNEGADKNITPDLTKNTEDTKDDENTDNEDSEDNLSEVQILKKNADLMGIVYPKNATVAKMKKLIAEHEAEIQKKIKKEIAQQAAEAKVKESEVKNKAKEALETYDKSTIGGVKSEALKLIKYKLIVHDPAKQNITGMDVSAGNDVIGNARRIIPLNTNEAWHAEAIILEHLRNMKYTQYPVNSNTASLSGSVINNHNEPKLVPWSTIIELPTLTEEELAALKKYQMENNTGMMES